ncbi:amidohydrolase family protein [Streptomyces litchfieldiae]|uniref:Amidohydrolase family protein n=1 Tax=Streptomyces litchfieldiae TaxID=3075543 RepID=A0ABU2MLV1_9ACTN|nr:amidohydrolase family protein [Streptomyces sp. DSM 44938]MDT0341903.1 amidohydrolase family protein [Streptomyces sp. DSM 44938]
MDITRRTFTRRGGQVAAGAVWLASGATALESRAWAATRDGRGQAAGEQVTVTEMTNASVALSPDGRTIAFDMLNLLWTVPLSGGEATRLTGIEQEATEPDFSPDGRRIVFVSYTDGTFHLWLINMDGTGLRQLSTGTADHREPRFSPDGSRIACAVETDGRYAIHVLSPDGGESEIWTESTAQEGQPVWTPDGSAIAFTSGFGSALRAIDLVDASGRRSTLATASEGFLAGPSLSPDLRLAYVHLTSTGTALVVDGETVTDEGEDVFPLPARWISGDELLYAADGKPRRRVIGGTAEDIAFTATLTVPRLEERPAARDFDSTAPRQVKGIVGPALSPDGTQVAFAALGDLWVMRRGTAPRAVVSDGHYNTSPAWSPDGATLVYASDRTGDAVELWLYETATGTRRQLTALGGSAASPAFSPDGSTVAFVADSATLHTVDVVSGDVRKVAGPLNSPGTPSFSGDGRHLAAAVLVPVTPRYREGRNQILTIDLESGSAEYSEPVPGVSLSNRVDAGPVYAPDGRRMAYVVGGTLRVSAVDDAGLPTGEAREVNGETADAPSWSGDSRSLLYLSDGRLRLADATDSGRARAVPVHLTWRPAKPSGRTVIQVGALWDGTDGTGAALRRDVDITIEGNRIADVSPRGTSRTRPGDRIVDARHLTAIPGLIALHEHGPWERNTTSRLWLSFGVTALRSPGTAHYRAVEAKEAVDSGRRTGPRLFAAGDIIDGSRIYYPANRPVTDEDELRRELAKTAALGHDLVKTYVRLPYALQRQAIEGAHRLGLPATSHYLFGPLALGADGVEHLGGTSRYGRRQKETHLGHTYQDVTGPLAASGMSLTPTLGLSGLGLPAVRAALYRYAEWAVGDPRLTGLLSPAEYETFAEGVEAALAEEPASEIAFVRRHAETIGRLIDGGAHLAIGTDSPLVPPAVYYHLNLQAMVRYGVSARDTLRAATAGGARTLGVSGDLGTVEPGKLADLTLVEGDPLADIAAAAAVRQVVTGGTVHRVDDLVAEAAEARSAAPAAVRNASLPDVPQAPARERFWWHREEPESRSCC